MQIHSFWFGHVKHFAAIRFDRPTRLPGPTGELPSTNGGDLLLARQGV